MMMLSVQFREMGYLASAMVNYLALLGWNDGSEDEIFTAHQISKFHPLWQTLCSLKDALTPSLLDTYLFVCTGSSEVFNWPGDQKCSNLRSKKIGVGSSEIQYLCPIQLVNKVGVFCPPRASLSITGVNCSSCLVLRVWNLFILGLDLAGWVSLMSMLYGEWRGISLVNTSLLGYNIHLWETVPYRLSKLGENVWTFEIQMDEWAALAVAANWSSSIPIWRPMGEGGHPLEIWRCFCWCKHWPWLPQLWTWTVMYHHQLA